MKIENELHYRVTKDQAKKFELALTKFIERRKLGIIYDERLDQAMEDALRSQWEELLEEIAAYEKLKVNKHPLIASPV